MLVPTNSKKGSEGAAGPCFQIDQSGSGLTRPRLGGALGP